MIDYWNRCSTAAVRAPPWDRTLALDHRGVVRTLVLQKRRATRCVLLRSWVSSACSMTAGCSTQAYLWMGIYDSQHLKNVKLEKELVRTQEQLKAKEREGTDLLWTLHELTNGAAQAALSLYRAGELQLRIDYQARDRLQTRVWRAEKEMNLDNARDMYRDPDGYRGRGP